MARKKAEIALQRELETQEEWEECMAMEGLWVVDVYQEWCGPCQALQGNFKRLKNELGDPLLQFAIAKADTIDALEQYRGRCEPTFLFFTGGILVSFVHGANAPKVLRIVTEQLAHEHKVIEGQAERKEVKDQVMTRSQEKEIQEAEEEAARKEAEASKYDETPKDCTVCIIKPDAVAAGKTDEIVAELQSRGIEILAQESRELTVDEATALYADLEDEEFFNDLIQFICSGPSHVMCLTSGKTGETVIDDIRGLMGPKDVEEAKENEPDSLRARYGDTGFHNAIHGSSTKETASRELAFFFPNLAIPTYLKKKENIQRTLAIIRPSAYAANRDQILEKIKEAGFTIAISKEVKLSKDQAAEFYGEHVGQPYFDQLIEEMSSGPLMALGMARDEAITAWRDMLGPPNLDDALEQSPDSMRAQFHTSNGVNQFHGSQSENEAKKDYDFFFPMQQTVAVVKPSGINEKETIIEKIHEAGFRIAARKETTIKRDMVDLLYPNQTEKEYYEDLVESMTSGATLFMVLTKEDAVYGWRSLMGNTDPAEAREKAPDSIRARLGEDILNNAVHGPTTEESAKGLIQPLFGELKFNEDGTLKGETPNLDVAEIEGEAGTAEEPTMDQTTIDQDATDISANATLDMTAADASEGDTTVAAEETETANDATVGETTMDDTTVADTTLNDTTVEETTEADVTTTNAEQTSADASEPEKTAETVDDTAGDVTADVTTESADVTAETTQADKTEAQTSQPEGDSEGQKQSNYSDKKDDTKPADKEVKKDENTAEGTVDPAAEGSTS